MIGLMMVLLTFFGGGDYDFNNVRVVAILRNKCGTQGQNYVTSFWGREMTAGFHYRNWILCICFRSTRLYVSQWCNG